MYPHVGVDASGLATLRATVATARDMLRGIVPTAHAVPAFAIAPVGPCYALADGLEQVPARARRDGRGRVTGGRRRGRPSARPPRAAPPPTATAPG
ncbi:hypothetical protein GCM10019016_046220 [Streptomyces prasinosporus]|uniref:RNA polymerase subunit sigma-24 n=1 Tax=Streptomyces prasinosporus TaxID=68256 RepID=A0ABP6TQE3_9ACTN